jgi:hypothetical protein
VSELVTNDEVTEAFQEARHCLGADKCKRVAQAMCKLYTLGNQSTIEKGEGLIKFAVEPTEPCPNQDQLFCQESEINH